MKNNFDKIKWPQLPKGFKTKWIKALRSGEYKQGNFILHHADQYCCLGVACSIYGYNGIQMGEHQYIEDIFIGIPEIITGNISNMVVSMLTSMNDGHDATIKDQQFTFNKKRSFKQIANFIEKYL